MAEIKTAAIAVFVGKVESKKGKNFNETELQKFPVELREESIKLEYVAIGSSAESFTLLPKGETFLLSRRPIEEQVAGLHRYFESMTSGLRAIDERIKSEITHLSEEASAIRSAGAEIAHEITAAGHKFEKVIGEIGAYGKLVSAARHFKETLDTKKHDHPHVPSDFEARLRDLDEKLAKRNDEFEALGRTFAERLEGVSRRLAELPVAPTSPAKTEREVSETTPVAEESEVLATV